VTPCGPFLGETSRGRKKLLIKGLEPEPGQDIT